MSVNPAVGPKTSGTPKGTAQAIAELKRRIKHIETTPVTIEPDSIDGLAIAPGSVTADTIAAGSVSATAIVSGTITALQIQAGSLTAGTIAAGAITADKIAAGSITADKIAAGSITADNIQAGSILAANITAGAINATHIQAGAIDASHIRTGSLVADNIQAGTITANQIAANTITASNIAAQTITATQIAAGSITGDRILTGSITASNLAAGAVTAATIAAGAIDGAVITGATIQTSSSTGVPRVVIGSSVVTSGGTYSGLVGTDSSNAITFLLDAATGTAKFKGTVLPNSDGLGNIDGATQNAVLMVGGKLLTDNPQLDSASIANYFPSNATLARDTTNYFTPGAGLTITSSAAGFAGATVLAPTGLRAAVTAGLPYSFGVTARFAAARATSVTITWYSATSGGTTVGSPSTVTFPTSLAGQWKRYVIENVTAPTGAFAATVTFGWTALGSGEAVYTDNYVFVQRSTASGAVVVADSITAAEISVGSLSAVSANLGTITSGTISSVTVTGGTIQTSASVGIGTSVSANGIIINASGLSGYSAHPMGSAVQAGGFRTLYVPNSGAPVFSGALNAWGINMPLNTGGASGGPSQIAWWETLDAAGSGTNQRGLIQAYTIGSTPYLLVRSLKGSSSNGVVQIDGEYTSGAFAGFSANSLLNETYRGTVRTTLMDNSGDMYLFHDLSLGTGATLRFPTAASGTPTLSTFGNALVTNANFSSSGSITPQATCNWPKRLAVLSDTDPGTGTSTCFVAGRGDTDYVPGNGNWTGLWQSNIHLNCLNNAALTFHDSGSRVDSITYGSGLFYIGANVGWGDPACVVNALYYNSLNARSDESMKTMGGIPEGTLESVMALAPRTYVLDQYEGFDTFHGTEKDDNDDLISWKVEGEVPKPTVGFSANEIAEVIPDASVTFPDGLMGYDMGHMIGILWGAVRELSAEVAALKEELA